MAKVIGGARERGGVAHLSGVRRLLQAFAQRGIDGDRLLARSGLEPRRDLIMQSNFAKPTREHWLPVEQLFAVWDEALVIDREGRFLSEWVTLHPAPALGMLGFHLLTAPTLLASLQRLTSGFELLMTGGHWEERQDDTTVTFVWNHHARSAGQCATNEAIFAMVASVLAEAAGESVPLVEARFRHRASATLGAISALVPTRVRHDSSHNALVFSREVLEARPRLAHEAMAIYFGAQVRDRLELVRSGAGVVEALKRAFFQEPVLGADSLFAASERLGMSARTLQRRLDAAGTSFSIELESARRQRAFSLVTTTERSLSSIAKDLGFADASSFARAFRRWYSAQPSSLRRDVAVPRVREAARRGPPWG